MDIIEPRSPRFSENGASSPNARREDGEASEPSIKGLRVMTAADLLKLSASAPNVSESTSDSDDVDESAQLEPEIEVFEDYVSDVEELAMGAVVNHAKYGAGSVVATDGEGKRGQVVVRFFGEKKTRQFVLRHVRLQLVRSN